MNYYEDEIAVLLKQEQELSIMYGISNFDVLYRYVVLRFGCDSIDEKKEEFIYKKNLIQFISNELRIEVKEGNVNYKGEFISINPIIGSCFANAIEDWCFSSTFYPVINEKVYHKI